MKNRKIGNKQCHHHNINNRRGYQYIWIMLASLTLLLCSCQKKQQITVYMGTSYDRDALNELRVGDGDDYQEALERCQERLLTVQEDSVEAADIYGIMGGIYAEDAEEQDNAVLYINKAIKIHQNAGDEMGLASDYNNMSKIYIYIGGKTEEGLEYLEKAEQIYKKHGLEDAIGLAGTLINKGHLYKNETQYEEALKAFKEAQEIYEKRQQEDITLHLLTGQAYLGMKEYALAEEQYFEAQQICEAEDKQYSMAEVEFQLGWLYGSMNDYNQAIKYYNQALDFYKTNMDYNISEAITSNNLAHCYAKNSELEKGVGASINACQVIEKVKTLTSETIEDKRDYKHNLSVHYKNWSKDESEENFEAWYQKVVLEGKDWKE